MERLIKLLLSRWTLGALLLVTLAGSIFSAFQLFTLKSHNTLLATPEKIIVTNETDPLLIFAKAYDQQQHGDPIEAIQLYGSILQLGDNRFRARVRFNLGTLYLRDAAKIWRDRGLLEHIRVNTLLSAAKDNLRESLILAPDQWDARYNLEYAIRITPPPKEKPKNDFQGSKGSVFATLPAIPGGGP
jgi:mxaK protein